MDQPTRPDLLSFDTTVGASHTGGTKVHNLSNLFIREFFSKLKTTSSGFENRKLSSDLDQLSLFDKLKIFIVQKEQKSHIGFYLEYCGQEVNVIKPSQFLIKPSDVTLWFCTGFVVKPITGDRNLKGSTFSSLDEDDNNIRVFLVRYQMLKILYGGEHYYQISVSKIQ